jgi:hypothetical protein
MVARNWRRGAMFIRDFEKARRAAFLMDFLRRKVDGWDGVKEIRRWRERKRL